MPGILWAVLTFVLLTACGGGAVSATVSQVSDVLIPTVTELPPTFTPIPVTATPMPTDTPSPTPTVLVPTSTPYLASTRFTVGYSALGQEIGAWQFGHGENTIVLIGGIHGGYEYNTADLGEALAEHFLLNPDAVLPGIRLVIIPVANPDGLALGSGLEGRFNGNGVDLNRNWGCNWSETAYLRDLEIDPGPRPFSEPETQALRAYFLAETPAAVIFYHSVLNAVFVGACGEEHPAAAWLGDLLEESTGYPYDPAGVWYPISGDAVDWLAERGIPGAEIELSTRTEPEFERNLVGVMALQCHFSTRASDYCP